jgi:DNA-binding XRE family transcriptional regulator
MKVRFMTTSKGEVAVLPRAEYERLRELANEADEDAGMVRVIARAKKQIAEGAPLLPKAVADRLAEGENPIRVLREWREDTQVELATRVGIAQNYLSDLEAGKRKGPWELHQKIARALGVPLDLLATVAVSLEEADPARFAKRKEVIAKGKDRRQRLRR